VSRPYTHSHAHTARYTMNTHRLQRARTVEMRVSGRCASVMESDNQLCRMAHLVVHLVQYHGNDILVDVREIDCDLIQIGGFLLFLCLS
jgi:hypothetical protein